MSAILLQSIITFIRRGRAGVETLRRNVIFQVDRQVSEIFRKEGRGRKKGQEKWSE